MTEFTRLEKKGLDGFWIESSLAPDRISLHITEIAPHTRAHPPHTHAGVEAFYILSGSGTLETEDGTQPRSRWAPTRRSPSILRACMGW